MKVLWVGNIILPKIAQKENLPEIHLGGWIVNSSELLIKNSDHSLVYVFDAEAEMHGTTSDGIIYYSLVKQRGSKSSLNMNYIQKVVDIIEAEKPELIHIWGTEDVHSLAVVKACEQLERADKVVVSIQGLISFCAKHYKAHLPERITRRYTLKDILQGNINDRQKKWFKNSESEIDVIHKAAHIIGRTEWDKACVESIHPNVKYHFNNEMLREEFYHDNWDIDNCEKYSIFFSQAGYPLKGLHFMLEALIGILKEYPDTKLYIAGKNHYAIPFYKRNSYENYLYKMIKKNNLFDHVVYTGMLDAQKMKERYLQSNVFVSASIMENSPNSVCEAMLLGVPTVSSRVGGVHSLITHGVNGFMYPVDETDMLSYYVRQIFRDREGAIKISENARKTALLRHDRTQILQELINIYQSIIKGGAE